jgi:hypothetical protein
MDGAEVIARDPRVRAILTTPDAYFSAAHRRAWPQAGADIELELSRRSRARRNGSRGLFRRRPGRRDDAEAGHDRYAWQPGE